MTKSVTGLVAQSLILEGRLDANKPLATYVPELQDSPFGKATVAQNFDMEVDVSYPANTPPDLGLFAAICFIPRDKNMPDSIYQFLNVVQSRQSEKPVWFYQNGSPEAVAWAMRKVTGKSWSELVSERLWSHVAANDADVQVDHLATEMASGGMSTTLRDAARFAQVICNTLQDKQPATAFNRMVRTAVAPHDNVAIMGASSFGPDRKGYSYHNYWYQKNDGDGSIEASGRFGQKIYINPKQQIVIVKFSSTSDEAPCATGATDDPQAKKRPADSMAAYQSMTDAVVKQLTTHTSNKN